MKPKNERKEPREFKELKSLRQKTAPPAASNGFKDPIQPQTLKDGRSDGRKPDSSAGSVSREPGSSSNSKERPKTDTTTLSEEDQYFLMHPDSVMGNTDLRELINYQTYCAMPSATQDAFASLLPPEVFLDERLSMQGKDGKRRLAEAFFKNADWTHALESWVEGLQLGIQTATYQEVKRQMTAIAEEEDQWKSEAYEEYYGEHAARENEAKLTASGSAKMSTARMGKLGGIRVGDQLRYQRSFKVPVAEPKPDPAHQDHDGDRAKDGERRGRRAVKSTSRPSTTRERSVHVDMRLCVLRIKEDGTPIVQFVETRAPADAEEPESAYQARLARSKDPEHGYEFVSAVDLEVLCLERDGQVPESLWVPRQRKGGASQPQKGAEESWKDFDLIRGTVRVGSLFAVRMDLWVEEKNVKSRQDQYEIERALAAEEAESSSRKTDKGKAKGKGKAKK
ncbi:Polycomb group protein asxl1 [Podila epicladia]|nr:Polycomb group protein asxl1 [Podila epicladia]